MTSVLRIFAIGTIVASSSLTTAQSDSCLERATDLASLEACAAREIGPLEEQYVGRMARLLSKYGGAEADLWRQILDNRDRGRMSTCLAEGEIHALRSVNNSTLERRRGFAVCQKRILQSMLQSLADCEQTSSLCERAMSMEGAGYEPRSAQAAIPQLTDAQKQLMDQSSTASARARVSYCSGPALQAVADLEHSIPLTERVHNEIWSPLAGSTTLMNYDLLLRHGRLAKLYRSLGNSAQSEKHQDVARSLKIGDKYVSNPLALVSEEDMKYCAGLK